MSGVAELADELLDDRRPQIETPRLRQAVVQSVSGTLATVRIGGSTTDIPNVPSLVPVVAGDTVWIQSFGPSLMIVSQPDTGWREVGASGEPAFENSWTHFDANNHVKFRKINGVVYLCGFAKPPVSGTSSIFTLPARFRPPTGPTRIFLCQGYNAGDTAIRVEITGAGVVSNAQTVSGGGHLSFDSVRFIAEQ